MSSDKCNAKGDVGVQPSGGPKDSRDVKLASRGWGMVLLIGDGGLGGGGAVTNEKLH